MFEKEAEEIANKRCHEIMCYGHCSFSSPKHHRCGEWHREYECALKGAEFGYNKANEWQTGEPIKGREIFARNSRNCNLLATYFDGAWRNVWNGAVVDFNKITMWRYTGFKNNGEKIAPSKEIE